MPVGLVALGPPYQTWLLEEREQFRQLRPVRPPAVLGHEPSGIQPTSPVLQRLLDGGLVRLVERVVEPADDVLARQPLRQERDERKLLRDQRLSRAAEAVPADPLLALLEEVRAGRVSIERAAATIRGPVA